MTQPHEVSSARGARLWYFAGCVSLETLTVDKRNPVYHSVGNCVIETATGAHVQGCNNSVIPTDGSVTSIGDYAFSGCDFLASVTFEGKTEEWRAIEKGTEWDRDCPFTEVKCSDGNVSV